MVPANVNGFDLSSLSYFVLFLVPVNVQNLFILSILVSPDKI